MKKLMKDAKSMIGSGIMLGVGSSVLGSAGSTEGQQALGNMSKAMPMMGNLAAAGAMMRGVKKLGKKNRY